MIHLKTHAKSLSSAVKIFERLEVSVLSFTLCVQQVCIEGCWMKSACRRQVTDLAMSKASFVSNV